MISCMMDYPKYGVRFVRDDCNLQGVVFHAIPKKWLASWYYGNQEKAKFEKEDQKLHS